MASSCGPNQTFSKGLCYAKCKDGFTGVGPTCLKNCPGTNQFLNLGPLCQKVPIQRNAGTVPQIEPCPNGQVDNGRDCVDKLNCAWPNQCTGTGLPAITFAQRQKCKGNYQEVVNGLCYDRCPSNQTGQGDKCLPNCPSGFYDDRTLTGYFCVKPSQGRGLGSPPLYSPLQQIAQSPNGSTLLERYRAGSTVAQQSAAINQQSSFFGSNLGDPANPKNQSNIKSTLQSFTSSTFGTLNTTFQDLSFPGCDKWVFAGGLINLEAICNLVVLLILITLFVLFAEPIGTAIINFILGGVSAGISGSIKAVTTGVSTGLTGVGQIGQAGIGALGGVGKEVVKQGGEFVGTGEEALGTIAGSAGIGLGTAVSGAETGIAEAARGAVAGVGRVTRGVEQGLGQTFAGTGELLQGIGTGASKAIQTGSTIAQAVPQQYVAPTAITNPVPVLTAEQIQNFQAAPNTGALEASGGSKLKVPSWFMNLSPDLQDKLLRQLM